MVLLCTFWFLGLSLICTYTCTYVPRYERTRVRIAILVAVSAVGVVGVAVWVAAVVVTVAVVEGEGGDIDAGTGGGDDFSLPDSVDADRLGRLLPR